MEALKQTSAQVAILVPSIVAELARAPELLEYCASHLELILYIGGDLPQAIGDLVAPKIKLHCWWGASECGIPHQVIPSGLGKIAGDWRYIRFHSSVGAVFEQVTEDTYELVMRRNDALPQPCFSVSGHETLKEYRTKDLFTRHPNVEDAWCWRARADDIIVFLNGEKTNPISMEQHIMAKNPELGGALVAGAQRFQTSLIIDPIHVSTTPLSTSQQAALIEKVWPSVQEANSIAPAHARVEKGLILITAPDRAFIRAGKGTIQRAASLAQYTTELDTLYTTIEHDRVEEITPGNFLVSNDAESISRSIRDTVSTITPQTELEGDSANFFESGMDSLQALQLMRALRRLYPQDFGLSTIYSNPNISKLTAAILAQRNENEDFDINLMEELLKTYRELILQIPKSGLPRPAKQNKPVTVILTGSTGMVGTFILRALLDRSGVDHVFCLNRGEDGGHTRQKIRFKAAGLVTDDLNQRVTFLKADFTSPNLGLDQTVYQDLRTRAGIIIHNAWPVNFNLRLAAFRPQLTGMINLLSLAAGANINGSPHFIFISSVGAVGGLLSDGVAAPESILSSMNTPFSNGYSRSKFLSELLCNAAAQHLGLSVTITRIGQVAGAIRRPGGIWNRAEWFPSLVMSSLLRLRCLPDTLGRQFSGIDWIPSDLLADVIVDLATQNDMGGARVFNVRNPHTIAWASLLPVVINEAEACLGYAPEVVSSSLWLERLASSEREGIDNDIVNPAIKLLDFYRNGLWGLSETCEPHEATKPMDMKNAMSSSKTLQSVPVVKEEWMRKWISEWVAVNNYADM